MQSSAQIRGGQGGVGGNERTEYVCLEAGAEDGPQQEVGRVVLVSLDEVVGVS